MTFTDSSQMKGHIYQTARPLRPEGCRMNAHIHLAISKMNELIHQYLEYGMRQFIVGRSYECAHSAGSTRPTFRQLLEHQALGVRVRLRIVDWYQR